VARITLEAVTDRRKALVLAPVPDASTACSTRPSATPTSTGLPEIVPVAGSSRAHEGSAPSERVQASVPLRPVTLGVSETGSSWTPPMTGGIEAAIGDPSSASAGEILMLNGLPADVA
jgi:hypothetical protein